MIVVNTDWNDNIVPVSDPNSFRTWNHNTEEGKSQFEDDNDYLFVYFCTQFLYDLTCV